MKGKITTIDLVIHAITIIQAYGISTYFTAWKVAFRGGTFLEAIYK